MSEQQYGVGLQWSTLGADKPASCILDSYNYRDAFQQHEDDDEGGNLAVLTLHGRKGEIDFGGTITDASTDLPDLSAGARIDLSSLSVGTVLCRTLVEEWSIGASKKFSGNATHYPDVTGGDGADAGTLNGFTPTQAGPRIHPGGKIIWSTAGLSHAEGIVQRLRIEQTLSLTEQVDEAADIVHVTAHKYLRRISLEILAGSAADRPDPDTALVVAGAPAHAANAIITDAGSRWQKAQGKMFSVEAIWFPGISTTE